MKFKGLALLIAFVLLAGCSGTKATSPANHDSNGGGGAIATEQPIDGAVARYEGEPSREIKNVYTTVRKMALTFDGLPEAEKLEQLLDELDHYDAKATFFVTGMRAAEEPELLLLIQQRGHEVQSLGLTRQDYSDITYQEIYKSMLLGKQTIERGLEQELKLIRAVDPKGSELLPQAAAHSGYEAMIGYSLFLKDASLDEQFAKSEDLRLYITRGGIIDIDLERNSRISELMELVNKGVSEVGYKLVTVSELLQDELEFKSYNELVPGDTIGKHPVAEDTTYTFIEHGDRSVKEVSLTIDDWGTDYTVTKMMDILNEYDVPATFFVRANGAEHNPSLARSMLEAGFEVANHTYSHPVVTSISDDELQEEVVKAHQVLTEALQQKPLMLFRPPTGEVDDHAAKVVAATGYTTIANFDLTTHDWNTSRDAQAILSTVLDEVQNGSVILIHMLDDLHTLEALPELIKQVRERGYTFVPMSKMVERVQEASSNR